jgi:hypothetical protein
MGLPQQLDGETYPGERRELVADLQLSPEGCAYAVTDGVARLAIWPAGSALSNPVRLPDGAELADGDPLRAIGTVLPFTELAGIPDGYWGMVTGFCAGDVAEALVFDRVSADR